MDPSFVRADNNLDGVCYAVPSSWEEAIFVAPNVTLHFAGMLDLQLTTYQSLLPNVSTSADTSSTIYFCMAYASAGSVIDGARNVVGNYQQQNFLVEYDLANSSIGIASSTCDDET
ncbi:hypothetical protein L7F22_030901 [Adiantum nelumboides]|nr:hypothetical protein [Adiantum nelumboides]